tara:strand:- start:2325 stop:2714 length:390 start_codon:yes stop_codon:yes gene_type:complete
MENNLNAKNFVLYAAKHYDNPGCESIEEFHDDLNRFKYIKRLFTKYQETGKIKERLVLNHLIALYNLFGPIPTTRMLFLKLDGNWELLKPFLVYLGYMPERLYEIGQHAVIIDSNISLDDEIVKRLRKI